MERGKGDGGWWPEPEDDEDRPGEETPTGEAGGEEPPGDAGPQQPETPRPPHPPRGLSSRDRPKAASRYSLFVGLAFAALVIVAILNATSSEEGGILGAHFDDSRGVPIAEFALPDVLSGVEADANVAQDDCESSRNPCPADEVRVPACEIDTAEAIRVCDLFDKPLAISFWFTRGGDCIPTQDAFDAVAERRSDEVNFLSVNVLDDAADVEKIVREEGWQVPVGHDRDGAVSNLFGVGVCPTIVLAYPGGIIHGAAIEPGNFTEEDIDRFVDDLLEASAAREPGGAAAGAGAGSL
jgi:hypothetical protein